VMTCRSWGRRCLFTEAGTVSVSGTSLIAAPARVELDRRHEGRDPVCSRRQDGADVVHDVGRGLPRAVRPGSARRAGPFGYDGLSRPHLDGLNRPHHGLPDVSVALIWPRL
jgi:hypothetical protein